MRKLRRIVLVSLLTLLMSFLALVTFILHESKDEVNATFENVETQLQSFYNEKRLGGFAVAVFDADSVFFSKGFGYSDLKQRIPYTTQTQQYVASIAKTTIGIALLKAQEQGLLALDDPINKYLPFEVKHPKFPELPITIRQLATHTAALDYNEVVVESLYISDSLKNSSLAPFMMDYFGSDTVTYSNYAPGSDWNYSNIGASLAAYIIELQSGKSFADFTQEYIFDPLGMKQTAWFEKNTAPSLRTKYYEVGDQEIEPVATSGVQLYPSRDLITNAVDLTNYCQAIIARDELLLSATSFKELLRPQLNNSVSHQSVDNHAIFFMIDRNQYGITYQMIGMNGGDNCINTMMWFDPVTQLGYIFIGNTGASSLNRVHHIWIYRTLVSLGDHIMFSKSWKYRWHNVKSRLTAML
ncbi:MAG: serine hydrolase [Bacteroidota bacterium]